MFLTAKMAQALQHAQSALRLDPGHEPAMRLRKRVKDVDRLKEEGNTAFKTGQLEEAVTKYGEAIEVWGCSNAYWRLHLESLITLQRIGADDSEGKGGHIRAMLLSNRATALLKVRTCIPPNYDLHGRRFCSSDGMKKPCRTPIYPSS